MGLRNKTYLKIVLLVNSFCFKMKITLKTYELIMSEKNSESIFTRNGFKCVDMKSMNPPSYKLFGLQIVALYKYITFYSS